MEKEIEHTFLVDKTPGANDYTSFKRGYELGTAAERAKLAPVMEAAQAVARECACYEDPVIEALEKALRDAGRLTEEGK